MASLTGLVQEALVTLLLFDAENGPYVRNLVPIKTYDPPYRRLAERAIAFLDEMHCPAGEHAIDVCQQVEADDPGKAKQVRELFESIQQCREGINAKYVLSQAATFVEEQGFRSGIIEAVGLLEQGKLGDAKGCIQKAMKGGLDLFEPGVQFGKTPLGLAFRDEVEALPTGIKLLDDRRLGPGIGELNLFIGPPKSGKSWWLLHLAKMARRHRKRVVYITLEMGEEVVFRRLLQSFFALSKRPGKLSSRTFREDELGRMSGIVCEDLKDVTCLNDPSIERKLAAKYARFNGRPPLIVKQFPTGSLEVQHLKGYLDSLEIREKVTPDLLLIDYPDLMLIDKRQDYRIALGVIYKELRGLARERNMAVAVVSQTNRQAVGKKLVTEKDVGEDFSKIATADVAFTYNQTPEERLLGLARLYVANARNDEDKFTILLSQNYAIGQFCLSSTRMMSRAYWAAVEEGAKEQEPKKRKQL